MDNDNIELLYKKFFIRFLKEQGEFSEYAKIIDYFSSPLEFKSILENRTPLKYEYLSGYKWRNLKNIWLKINIDNETEHLLFCKRDIKYKNFMYKNFILHKKIENILFFFKEEPFLSIILSIQIFIIIVLTLMILLGVLNGTI